MPVPPHVIAASLAALGLHDPEVPVARLVGDSLVDDVPLIEGTDRRLIFEGDGLRAEVSVSYVGERRRLRVEVQPADYDVVTILQPGNQVHQPPHDVHQPPHDVADVAPGLTTLILRHKSGGDSHRTAWVVV